MRPTDGVDRDRLLRIFLGLVAVESPSGQKYSFGAVLEGRFDELECQASQDDIGNLVAVFPGPADSTPPS
jgi:tripeptide aminopeptidase